MSEEYIDIPIEAAADIADRFEKDRVIIITYDEIHNRTHVTTFGVTRRDCAIAAQDGNRLKWIMGWPEELCNELPERLKP